jgi:hypothetical protein
MTQQGASYALAKNHSVWVIAAAAARGHDRGRCRQCERVDVDLRVVLGLKWSPTGPPRSKRKERRRA